MKGSLKNKQTWLSAQENWMRQRCLGSPGLKIAGTSLEGWNWVQSWGTHERKVLVWVAGESRSWQRLPGRIWKAEHHPEGSMEVIKPMFESLETLIWVIMEGNLSALHVYSVLRYITTSFNPGINSSKEGIISYSITEGGNEAQKRLRICRKAHSN